MNRQITLGSLFDGSGGFPLAGMMHGITPIWASEIEPYPLKVTAARLPQMKQLGDVKKINGAEIAPVDIITFGSPCQDLSVAGKQKGIHDGDRSSLFFEAIRIIKEMRDARADKFPRFCVFENVPGAFSSNQGEDFRAVLEAISGIAEEGVSIPRPPKSKWDHAGYVVADGWSIAWRVYDAQYWPGTPQRRKRIYLIADFRSERAGEILFKQESLCRDPAEGGTKGKGTAADAEGSTGRSSISAGFAGKQGAKSGSIGYAWEKSPTLRSSITTDIVQAISPKQMSLETGENKANTLIATDYKEPQCVAYALEGNTIDRKNGQNGKGWSQGTSPTLNTQDKHGIVTYAPETNHCKGYRQDDISANGGDGALVVEPMSIGNGQMHNMAMSKIANTLDCMHDPQAILMDGKPKRKYIVRRLTPLECCRLQGFPDGWEEGVEGSDSARYRMWGNGIALPCAADVLGRIAKELRRGD